MKKWGDLSPEIKQRINKGAETIIEEHRKKGDERIAQLRQALRELYPEGGVTLLTDKPLASYAAWPAPPEETQILEMGRAFEDLFHPAHGRLRLVQDKPASAGDIERTRTARTPLLKLLEAEGVEGSEAERMLHQWLPSSYGVATLLFVDQGEGHQLLIEIKKEDRNGALTISFPEEQVRPGETLEEAARRGLGEQPIQFLHKEGLICAPFGPHVQPAHLTFVVVATATGGKRIAPGTSPYGVEQQLVSTHAMYLAIMQNQMTALARELGTESVVIPQNVVNPARYHFQSWISSRLVVPQT